MKKGIEIKERGGTVVGESHADGGVPFVLKDTGTHIEEEGDEINIPRELGESDKVYEFTGTNRQILNKILKLADLSLNDEVTEVKSGDIVICIKSAWDDEERTYKGTIRQILSAINESRGCKHIESGAIMIEDGKRIRMDRGGLVPQGTPPKYKKRNKKYYTYQNPTIPFEISHHRVDDFGEKGIMHHYKLALYDKDGYSYSSKWISEDSISKIPLTKKTRFLKHGGSAENNSGINWIITGTYI